MSHALRALRRAALPARGPGQTTLIFAGASVGVAVIIFLSALIDGLQASLVDKTLGSQAHILLRAPDEAARPLVSSPDALVQVVRPAQRLRTIDQWQQVLRLMERTPGVTAVSPSVSGAVLVSRGTASLSIAGLRCGVRGYPGRGCRHRAGAGAPGAESWRPRTISSGGGGNRSRRRRHSARALQNV